MATYVSDGESYDSENARPGGDAGDDDDDAEDYAETRSEHR